MIRSLLCVGLLHLPLLGQVEYSGVYPHLAMSNREGECGTGAVVPWAGKLWVITYAPHQPKGSTDKLYEITPDLKQTIRPESLGGTPANRMIHEESQQLFIGPHVIDAQGGVRTIPYTTMYGRHTGNARHLTDPAGKILYATMEEGIYEVDVKSLAVKDLWIDEQLQPGGPNKKGTAETKEGKKADLPGYHGKGFYSAQGRYVYANNGEHGSAAKVNPRVPSGVLAEWDGKADQWTIVRRNQFTEVTGPGGIMGKAESPDAPLWAVGWDHRSLILMCLHDGAWHAYRLPKGSHSYDGAHGWNTEWPRIRDIGEKDFLMTMHGTFWKFPKDFTPQKSAGITPRSNYLKVIGDFCEWQGKVVLGCDDTAKSEFLNKRKAKGDIAPPRSQSNLWFVKHEQLDQLGPAMGRGAVWLNDAVKAGDTSDPYLFSGYQHRIMHVAHNLDQPLDLLLEVDRHGDGRWTGMGTLTARPGQLTTRIFPASEQAAWIRVRSRVDVSKLSVCFSYRHDSPAASTGKDLFAGIAEMNAPSVRGGTLRALDDDALTLAMMATDAQGKETGYYTMGADMTLVPGTDAKAAQFHRDHCKMTKDAFTVDDASALVIDDKGRRWRFPRGSSAYSHGGKFGNARMAREVATERDLLNLCGTFYELPAENAGGFALARPVTTHNRLVHDFCSWRGLLLISGIADDATPHAHLIRSADGKAALWAGVIDDVWKLGKPRGEGGPWKNTPVKKGQASDPYLMTGYDRKSLTLAGDQHTTIIVEVDISGWGDWVVYDRFSIESGKPLNHQFDPAFSAYWIRFTSEADSIVSAQLSYE